jgi:hypothetical protein
MSYFYCYTECCYTECHIFILILNVVCHFFIAALSYTMLRVVLQSVSMLIVIFFSYAVRVYAECYILIVTLSAIMLSATFLFLY